MKIPETMPERSLWALWILMIGASAVWLLVGSVGYWARIGWLPPDTAGWVQAIGSLAAVFCAAGIAWFEYRARQAASRKRQDVTLALLGSLAVQGCALASELFRAFEMARAVAKGEAERQRVEVTGVLSQAESALASLRGFNNADLPDARMIAPLLTIRGGLEFALNTCRAAMEAEEVDYLVLAVSLAHNSQRVQEAGQKLQLLLNE